MPLAAGHFFRATPFPPFGHPPRDFHEMTHRCPPVARGGARGVRPLPVAGGGIDSAARRQSRVAAR
ncbi:hypothetical protein WG70_06110 [Burkholderia oklahomensis EO147]|nr:hypothetical protein WG70_06110 [Burkholderia oklahomensis EO147]KUY51723.1 hypothetical protein WG70_15665 [Burkholderia oklahomensis EO147]